jgi:hypothetical protein
MTTTEAATAASYDPSTSPIDVGALPMLNAEQAGHLRHLRNISDQLPGEWRHMRGAIDHMGGGPGPMLYKVIPHSHFAMMLGFYNRLPAAPGLFRETSHRLIRQMLDKEVWGYWRLMSTSGKHYDPDLVKEREPWADPVVKENIMYSGRLAMMLGLHSTLFDDDTYEKPGSVVFDWDVPFSGGPAQFRYSLHTLNEQIHWQLVESGFLGVPCEPNSVFLVCNQYALIGLRLRDQREGTKVAAAAAAGFRDAWERNRWLRKDGHLVAMYRPNQRQAVPYAAPLWDFYTGTYLSAWYPEFVREHYGTWARYAFRKGPQGTLSPWPSELVPEVVKAVDAGLDPGTTVDIRNSAPLIATAEIGQTLAFLAEIGRTDERDRMLAYMDLLCQPTWENGGLFYPRNDALLDKDGNFVRMDPWSGTASVAHARLSVENGLWNIYNRPWTQAHHAQPAIAQIGNDADLLRAIYLPQERALVWTVRSWHGREAALGMHIANMTSPGARWTLWRDGQSVGSGTMTEANGASLHLEITDEGLAISTTVGPTSDFVLQWS